MRMMYIKIARKSWIVSGAQGSEQQEEWRYQVACRIIELSLPSQEQLGDNYMYKIQLKPLHKANLDLGLVQTMV